MWFFFFFFACFQCFFLINIFLGGGFFFAIFVFSWILEVAWFLLVFFVFNIWPGHLGCFYILGWRSNCFMAVISVIYFFDYAFTHYNQHICIWCNSESFSPFFIFVVWCCYCLLSRPYVKSPSGHGSVLCHTRVPT